MNQGIYPQPGKPEGGARIMKWDCSLPSIAIALACLLMMGLPESARSQLFDDHEYENRYDPFMIRILVPTAATIMMTIF
jgi:hypothetical protein